MTKKINLFALVVFAFGGLRNQAANIPSRPNHPENPNIVYILCDDLGYGDVHGLNPDRCKIATPNLDRLAAQGMTFTDAHSTSAVCSPRWA